MTPQEVLPNLYLNENVAISLVEILRSFGITAIHTLSVNNNGISDERQLQYAAAKNYILVTHNRDDFKKLHNLWLQLGKNHSGILVMRYGEPNLLARRINLFLELCYPNILKPFCVSPPMPIQ